MSDEENNENIFYKVSPEGVLKGIRFLSEKEQRDIEEKRLIESLSYFSHNFRNFILKNPREMIRILKNAEEVEKKRNNDNKSDVGPMTEVYLG